MSAPRTSPDTEPPSLPHDPTPLSRVLARVSASRAAGGPTPVVVFDLDATLYDNRPRTLAIVREFAATVPASEAGLRERLDTLTLDHMRYLVADALELVGVTDPSVVKRVTSFWWARFFRDRYIKHDVPAPGAVAFAQACYDAGANLVYLTGRDLPGMLTGTVKKLRDDAFPYAVAGTQVILKPTKKASDDAFKRAVLPTLTRLGAPVAFFDNEPANCNAARELLPDADVIWLDTQCVPNPPPLAEGIPMVRHFEGFR
ncbi:MAG: haloacid dehalogenase-like hydrolase [Polyangiales bacterium]|nr:haloacid dehalogenase-like hydrolase [Myxococcales bacterium]MCB9657886.1 haloacid dehalogenase-like hydrolase [Sandaracinaceae bacterium]